MSFPDSIKSKYINFLYKTKRKPREWYLINYLIFVGKWWLHMKIEFKFDSKKKRAIITFDEIALFVDLFLFWAEEIYNLLLLWFVMIYVNLFNYNDDLMIFHVMLLKGFLRFFVLMQFWFVWPEVVFGVMLFVGLGMFAFQLSRELLDKH